MAEFEVAQIEIRGWRQGSTLGPKLSARANERWKQLGGEPGTTTEVTRLVVVSQDCDIVHSKLQGEPYVEVLRAQVAKHDGQFKDGRNPRLLSIALQDGTAIRCRVHERWMIPREWLCEEDPDSPLPLEQTRLVAEWLAKRYIRAAFPTAFDSRWRKKKNAWIKLLEDYSDWIQGIYLQLSTWKDLDSTDAYRIELLAAVPADKCKGLAWPDKRKEIESAISQFWEQFGEDVIKVDEVDVSGTHEITFARIDNFQRFDADWVSFADDGPSTPANIDMRL